MEWAKIFNLFVILAYFCYYLLISLHFLILFISPIVLFSLFFNFFSTLLTKNFQFQLNKLFSNGQKEHMIRMPVNLLFERNSEFELEYHVFAHCSILCYAFQGLLIKLSEGMCTGIVVCKVVKIGILRRIVGGK